MQLVQMGILNSIFNSNFNESRRRYSASVCTKENSERGMERIMDWTEKFVLVLVV